MSFSNLITQLNDALKVKCEAHLDNLKDATGPISQIGNRFEYNCERNKDYKDFKYFVRSSNVFYVGSDAWFKELNYESKIAINSLRKQGQYQEIKTANLNMNSQRKGFGLNFEPVALDFVERTLIKKKLYKLGGLVAKDINVIAETDAVYEIDEKSYGGIEVKCPTGQITDKTYANHLVQAACVFLAHEHMSELTIYKFDIRMQTKENFKKKNNIFADKLYTADRIPTDKYLSAGILIFDSNEYVDMAEEMTNEQGEIYYPLKLAKGLKSTIVKSSKKIPKKQGIFSCYKIIGFTETKFKRTEHRIQNAMEQATKIMNKHKNIINQKLPFDIRFV